MSSGPDNPAPPQRSGRVAPPAAAPRSLNPAAKQKDKPQAQQQQQQQQMVYSIGPGAPRALASKTCQLIVPRSLLSQRKFFNSLPVNNPCYIPM